MSEEPEANATDLQGLIALCLELYEREGSQAVEELLARHPEAAPLIRERIEILDRVGLLGEAPAASRPTRIGAYSIVGELGRGGMSVVYEACQESPRRRVAVKLLRSVPGERERARLRHEAEFLARLQHPGIAHVYEVGTAHVGGIDVPFFAMELVDGKPLDAYANEAGLGLRKRLELLAAVCDAVHYAHQKGLIHRDIKPANVLVDERGQPRVLDFGIARTVDPALGFESLRTQPGQLIGTLAYMSPEQASGDPAELDIRTDVYSLGVVAFELLSGRLPHRTDSLPVLAALQSIRQHDAPRLSTIDPSLRGDVETIVAKALEKDKNRRYSSLHELAADLRRFLSDEPISARPATARYQLAKFARRHRTLVTGAVAVVLALTLGLAGTLVGMVRAAHQRDDAERRFRLASSVRQFQSRMFALADPLQEGILVEDLLDRGVLLVDAESDDRLEEAALRQMLGEAYEALGLYEKAEPLLVEATAIHEAELGLEDLQTLAARVQLAALYGHPMMRLDEAQRTIEGIEETAARVHGTTHDVTLAARLTHATIAFERGQYADAARIVRDVLDVVGPEHPRWMPSKKRLAQVLQAQGDIDRAVAIAREVYDWNLARYGKAHPGTWSAMDTLGNMLVSEGRLIEGLAVVDELWELRNEHLGREHPDTINALANVGLGYLWRGEYDRSEEILRGVLDEMNGRLPAGHPQRLSVLNNLANSYAKQGRPGEAEPIFAEVVQLTSAIRGPEHDYTLTAKSNRAMTLLQLGRLEEAEELYLETLEAQRRVYGDDEAGTVKLVYNLASFYMLTGRHLDADPLYREAIEAGRTTFGPDNFELGVYLRGHGVNLTYLGRFEEAEMVLMESRDHMERTLPDFENHPSYARLLTQFETLYTRWGRPEEAAAYRAVPKDED